MKDVFLYNSFMRGPAAVSPIKVIFLVFNKTVFKLARTCTVFNENMSGKRSRNLHHGVRVWRRVRGFSSTRRKSIQIELIQRGKQK